MVLLFGAASLPAAVPGQPYAGLWHLKDTDPAYILNYDIHTDPDAPYMRSGTPLATRGRNAGFKINSTARGGEGGVTALSSFHAANNNPAQGERTGSFLDYYAFAHWQYLDQLVMWGGSAGAGIILAPNPTLIDAAHRSGAPVLGNIFFPPTDYGGKIEWVQALVQKSGSTYPVADKLIEIADYCGFDGWFVNQETAGGDTALATEVRNFLKYIQANSSLKIMWYDAMTETGAVSWQNTLNSNNDAFFQDNATRVSDTFFADFGWTAANVTGGASVATGLGRSPYEVYFGVDVQSDGYNTTVNWGNVWPAGAAHRASVGLYQPNWTFDKSGNDSTVFYQRERQFWSGPNEDPSNPPNTANATDWEGIAHDVQEWSPLQQLPFVTNFCVGHGNRFYQKGVQVRAALDAGGVVFNWHNLTTQDILPSWQWAVQTSSATPLTPAWYWGDAYTGGSCLRVTGTLDAVNELKLYQANLTIGSATSLRIAYRDNDGNTATNLKVAVAFADAPSVTEYFDVGNRTGTGWSTKVFSLAAHSGRTLGRIGLQFDPAATGTVGNYTMQMGELSVYNGTLSAPAAPTNATIENEYTVSTTRKSLRVRWTPSPSSDVRYYNIYRRNADATRTWLWAASRDACFVPEVDRAGNETTTTIEVEAVGRSMEVSTTANATLYWNEPPTISAISGKQVDEGASTAAIPFTIGDALTPPASLTLNGSSSNTALLPAGGIVFGGSGANRTVTLTPNPSASGNTTVTLMVTDGEGLTAGESFKLTVLPSDGVDGALARWPFDGSLGDTTGSGWNLTHSGSAVFSTMRQQGTGSLQFNGTSDSAFTAAAMPLGGQFTVCAWVYVPSGTTQIQTVAANSAGGATTNGFRFYVNGFNTGDGKLVLATGNGTAGGNISSAAGVVAFDRWQHVAAVVDRGNGTTTLYRNGVSVASGAIRNDFANEAVVYLGAMNTQFRFQSHMDEARIYGRALTAAEITAIVNVANTAPTAGNIADQNIGVNATTGAVAFTVGDNETTAAALTLNKSSSNTVLVPAANIVFGGSGANRTVTVTPASGRLGNAVVTVGVNDGTLTAYETFLVTVTGTAMETWRFAHFGTTANTGNAADTADPDGDVRTNAVEYVDGTNPVSADHGTDLAGARDGADFVLTFTARRAEGPGYEGLTRYYDVETTTSLAGAVSWSLLAGAADIAGANQTVTILVPLAAGPHFYRLTVRLE